MDKELWKRCQMLVDAGMGHLVKHLYQAEIEALLTKEQLSDLGDTSELLDKFMESKANMKDLIESLAHLYQHGVKFSPEK